MSSTSTNHLAQHLAKTGMTQEHFARIIGVKQSTISKLCAGKIGLSLATAVEIERATNGAVTVRSWFRKTGGDDQ